MAEIDDQIAATAFTVTTSLTEVGMLEAAESAARQADGAVDRFSRMGGDGPVLHYVLKRAKVTTIGDCHIAYSPDGPDGSATVSFRPGQYVRHRPTRRFVPIGPWESAALKPLQRFSCALRESVAG